MVRLQIISYLLFVFLKQNKDHIGALRLVVTKKYKFMPENYVTTHTIDEDKDVVCEELHKAIKDS